MNPSANAVIYPFHFFYIFLQFYLNALSSWTMSSNRTAKICGKILKIINNIVYGWIHE